MSNSFWFFVVLGTPLAAFVAVAFWAYKKGELESEERLRELVATRPLKSRVRRWHRLWKPERGTLEFFQGRLTYRTRDELILDCRYSDLRSIHVYGTGRGSPWWPTLTFKLAGQSYRFTWDPKPKPGSHWWALDDGRARSHAAEYTRWRMALKKPETWHRDVHAENAGGGRLTRDESEP